MKHYINEAKRMQQLAGIIKENKGIKIKIINKNGTTTIQNTSTTDLGELSRIIDLIKKSKNVRDVKILDEESTAEIKRMQQLARLSNENQEVNESPMSLSDQATELYDKMLKTGKPFDIDDEGVDAEMERITKKQFTSMEFPKFNKLNDKQLQSIIPFLKAVIENGYFGMSDKWNGTEIVEDEDEDDNF